MDITKLESLAKVVYNKLPLTLVALSINPQYDAPFKNLLIVATEVLPDYTEFFSQTYKRVGNTVEARAAIIHLIELIGIEKTVNAQVKEGRIFDGAEAKLKQAGLSFSEGDFSSVFNCLNTAFELIIKDKVGIPTTITNVNTANIVEVLVKHKVDPFLYVNEVRKRVIDIDNKVKHQGYSPSKIDAINGIKAMEDLVAKMKDHELILTDEVKNKICDGL